jgi:hypothetical protein
MIKWDAEIGAKFEKDPDVDGELCNQYQVERVGERSFQINISV